jgi:hypothetical protein
MGCRYLVSFNAEPRKQTGRGASDEVEVELVADPERSEYQRHFVKLGLVGEPSRTAGWAGCSYLADAGDLSSHGWVPPGRTRPDS